MRAKRRLSAARTGRGKLPSFFRPRHLACRRAGYGQRKKKILLRLFSAPVNMPDTYPLSAIVNRCFLMPERIKAHATKKHPVQTVSGHMRKLPFLSRRSGSSPPFAPSSTSKRDRTAPLRPPTGAPFRFGSFGSALPGTQKNAATRLLPPKEAALPDYPGPNSQAFLPGALSSCLAPWRSPGTTTCSNSDKGKSRRQRP